MVTAKQMGRKGGRSRSEKKLKAILANLEKAHAARSRKAKSQSDDGQLRSAETGEDNEKQEDI